MTGPFRSHHVFVIFDALFSLPGQPGQDGCEIMQASYIRVDDEFAAVFGEFEGKRVFLHKWTWSACPGETGK